MQSPHAIAVLAMLLVVKHFLADGPLQSAYQLANKSRFMHIGGLLHAATHAAFTALCIAGCFWIFSIGPVEPFAKLVVIGSIAALEFVLHYAIDWLKCYFENAGGWSESTISASGQRELLIKDAMFFHAFLADQMLHSLTYVAVVCIFAVQI